MLNLKSLTAGVHSNAVDHGWWEEERNFGELIALCHSELSEALEEYRNGTMLNETYYSGKNEYGQLMQSHEKTENCKKPEGIPSELSDVVIRVLDMCGKEGLQEVIYFYRKELKLKALSFPEFITECHTELTKAYTQKAGSYPRLVNCINLIFAYAKQNGINIEAAILEKHEFNKTRPYKHGGKVI